jgi:hypothetical protein
MHCFDKMIIFRINKNKCFPNEMIDNNGKNYNIENLTWTGNQLNISFIKNLIDKIPFSLRKITKIINNKVNSSKIKKYFY